MLGVFAPAGSASALTRVVHDTARAAASAKAPARPRGAAMLAGIGRLCVAAGDETAAVADQIVRCEVLETTSSDTNLNLKLHSDASGA